MTVTALAICNNSVSCIPINRSTSRRKPRILSQSYTIMKTKVFQTFIFIIYRPLPLPVWGEKQIQKKKKKMKNKKKKCLLSFSMNIALIATRIEQRLSSVYYPLYIYSLNNSHHIFYSSILVGVKPSVCLYYFFF